MTNLCIFKTSLFWKYRNVNSNIYINDVWTVGVRGSGLSIVISLLCKLTYVLLINQNFKGVVVSSPG